MIYTILLFIAGRITSGKMWFIDDKNLWVLQYSGQLSYILLSVSIEHVPSAPNKI